MKRKINVIIIVCMILLFVPFSRAYALGNVITKGDEFIAIASNMDNPINEVALQETSNMVYNILFTIAVVIAFGVGMIIGIQFIVGSIDEKAKIKETLIPYVIGVAIIFSGFGIWKIAVNIGNEISPTAVATGGGAQSETGGGSVNTGNTNGNNGRTNNNGTGANSSGTGTNNNTSSNSKDTKTNNNNTGANNSDTKTNEESVGLANKPIYQSPRIGTKIRDYTDDTINVSVEKIGKFYVTKVWLQDPANQIQKVEGKWGKQLYGVDTYLNKTNNAIVGCNASGFYVKGAWEPNETEIMATSWNNTTEGYLVLTDGETRRKIAGQKCNCTLGILPNGSLKYYENNDYSDVINDGVKNTFTFGPCLILDGKAYTQKNGKQRISETKNAEKCAIGQIDENNFIIISSYKEGTESKTATLGEVRKIGLDLGCKLLYNLDGGGSTTLWYRNGLSGNGESLIKTGRESGDAICFVSGK